MSHREHLNPLNEKDYLTHFVLLPNFIQNMKSIFIRGELIGLLFLSFFLRSIFKIEQNAFIHPKILRNS